MCMTEFCGSSDYCNKCVNNPNKGDNMSKAEDIAKAIYIRCFDDEFKYPEVLNALRICAEENAETIEQLQEENKKLKEEVERMERIYHGTVGDKNKLFEKNNEAKEIIRRFYRHIFLREGFMELNDFNVWKNKAEAFLKK